jgi:TIR domain
MPGTIFISFRESDIPATARRLGEWLAAFGYHCLLMSEDRGAHGRDYPVDREETIATCDGFIAVIGPRWLARFDEHGRPGVQHRDDFVRKDITAALQRDVPILVALAERTQMPSPGMFPGDLLLLAYQPATEVNNARFEADMDRLVVQLRRLAPTDS